MHLLTCDPSPKKANDIDDSRLCCLVLERITIFPESKELTLLFQEDMQMAWNLCQNAHKEYHHIVVHSLKLA